MRYEAASEQQTKDLDKWQAWDEFLKLNTDMGFRQSSWYVTFMGHDNFGTVLRDGDTIVGGAVILKRSFTPEKFFYYIPDGPVFLKSDSEADQEQVFRAIIDFIERKRQNDQQVVSHLGINPLWEHMPSFVTEFQESSHYYGLPRNTQYIDLSPSESAILTQMKPKGRYNIGVARRYGVLVTEDTSTQGIEDFLSICEETYARNNLGEVDRRYFHGLIPMFSTSVQGSVFFAEYQGVRLATALVVYFGRTATYWYGGSRAIHRNVMAPYLLQFEIMRKAKALGCRYYDLFGIAPQSKGHSSWTDFSIFKRKFGGQELRRVPTLEYIYDPAAYREWEVWRIARSAARGRGRASESERGPAARPSDRPPSIAAEQPGLGS